MSFCLWSTEIFTSLSCNLVQFNVGSEFLNRHLMLYQMRFGGKLGISFQLLKAFLQSLGVRIEIGGVHKIFLCHVRLNLLTCSLFSLVLKNTFFKSLCERGLNCEFCQDRFYLAPEIYRCVTIDLLCIVFKRKHFELFMR